MVVGNKTIVDKNGKAVATMDVAPLIKDGRTMIPAKFVTEIFGGSVEWDANMKLASVITHPKTTLPQKEIVFGFIPSQEAENLDAKAKPLADALSKELGVPVKSFVGTNYNAVIEAMGAGKVDIGAYGPQSYVIAADKGYAVPAAASVRNGSKTYRAQFVVLKDSPLKKLEDVKGKKIAWVDPTSTSGYTYPAALLREKGIDPETDVQGTFAGGHDKSILALLRGDVDVAVSFDDARTIVEKSDPKVMEKTRILATTADIPNDLIALRAKLPDYWRAKIKEALFKIAMTEDGKKMLKDIYNITDLAPTKDSDYDIVRKVQKMNEGK
ncbi:MAG: phosphate/phosphite/phosphonate ABC transporter substrate-binding protein [Candidatus Carbobacillus altaicus]|nr:phosphate/phosphite/phosphonate ABC transporter substrate-binding protein [Candidatus Carbobacillus altaicus]